MIHAYVFVVVKNFSESHGKIFQSHMNRINKMANTRITIYHSWYNETQSLKQHWWRCQGSCRDRAPYFGYVKRSMNRAPSKNDFWYKSHMATCEGSFVKVREPSDFKQPNNT